MTPTAELDLPKEDEPQLPQPLLTLLVAGASAMPARRLAASDAGWPPHLVVAHELVDLVAAAEAAVAAVVVLGTVMVVALEGAEPAFRPQELPRLLPATVLVLPQPVPDVDRELALLELEAVAGAEAAEMADDQPGVADGAAAVVGVAGAGAGAEAAGVIGRGVPQLVEVPALPQDVAGALVVAGPVA